MKRLASGDAWSTSEAVLDLFQEKLLKFQKYYDLSVSERDALKDPDAKRLISIFQEKEGIQQQITSIDEKVRTIQAEHRKALDGMDRKQAAELKNSIELLVALLQQIIDYEKENKLIALTQKEDLQRQLQDISNGDMMLKGYFNRQKPKPRFIDQAR